MASLDAILAMLSRSRIKLATIRVRFGEGFPFNLLSPITMVDVFPGIF